ncbi:MAG TPA: GspE/PulE family protein [Opitutus sp.]|nr:GspE/PulE family protein [Opitutus sp.]
MFESHNRVVFELLKEHALVSAADLEALRNEQQVTGKPLANLAVDLGLVEAQALFTQIAASLGCDLAPEISDPLPADLIALLTGDLARNYGVVPVRANRDEVVVLATDPFNSRITDDLSFVLGRNVRMVVADPAEVDALIKRYYGVDEASVDEVLRELEDRDAPSPDGENLSVDDLEAMAGQTPVIRLVNLMLGQAIREKASDIHFEPFEHEFKVRYRIDGALYEMSPPPKSLALSVTSRIKVLANLNIAERRVPQDGRMKLTISGRPVDLRVSTLPTQFGESVVLRVLDQSAVQLSITDLGMPEGIVAGVREIVQRPNGIFVVTGPTGCGKTTTLYSALRLINTPDLKLLTAEDPVEYEIDGIVQVPVSPAVGLTFAATLRSFLRQDPDVIMVGEIRDLETAQIAIQASLTGHLVLSTLHTNDAAGAVTRLVDMGIEPFLIGSTVEAVLAQRLVRRVCPQCRRTVDPALTALEYLGMSREAVGDRPIFQATGCAGCHETGYRGRTGLYEWLRVTESIRELVIARSPTLVIRRKAIEQGMQILRESGIAAVLKGTTTVEEVAKYT